MNNSNEPILTVKNLKQYFNAGQKDEVKAVNDISFEIYPGETFGLVGESGSGKTTTGRSVLRLYNPTDGEVYFDEKDLSKINNREQELEFRKDMQMIFQDPYASLNPRMKVEDIVAEGLDIHKLTKNSKDRYNRVIELLEVVGLNEDHASRYPHEFSGGQRQRIGIARALAVSPKMIIADEPISALDVSVQAQIVNLLRSLQDQFDLTFLFIAHDLSMVKYISDRIGVMYNGKLVEIAESDELYYHALHPYTESLLSAIPLPNPIHERKRERIEYKPEPFTGKEEMTEITPGHFIFCEPEQVDALKEKRKKQDTEEVEI